MMRLILLQICIFYFMLIPIKMQDTRTVGKLQEVFAWKQLSYNFGDKIVFQDRSDDLTFSREKRYTSNAIYFPQNENQEDSNQRAVSTISPASVDPNDEAGSFFIQYNNVPMGVERVGRRLFITVPRRRYGIPSTLNYIDVPRHENTRSPPLTPYPDGKTSQPLVSVYRTRADECGRLWMVDTGAIEIPNNTQQIQLPAIVVFDLQTDTELLRYPFKSTDIPSARTPTGLASISVLVKNGDCTDTYAYIADVVTYGVIVYSLRENDSWRHTHNYFNFDPTAGNFRVADQTFQWNDGVFSIAIGAQDTNGCATAYFHPMVSREEFSVCTCALENRSTNESAFHTVGYRGDNSQSTMHGVHNPTSVMFFAEMGRDAVSCWYTGRALTSSNMATLAQDSDRLSYPSDLHVFGDEVWVMSNKLPRFIYSTLNTSEYNFFVYRAEVRDLIAGTICAKASTPQTSSPYHRGV